MLIDFKNRKWKKFVANIVSDYFDNSSIHGLKYLKEGNCFVGVFWLTSLILSTCGCSYLINKTYDKWDKSPVILTFDEKLISTSTIPFPAVTICPEIKFKRELFNISAIGWTVKQSEEQIRIENALHSICPYIQTHTSTIYESFENMTGELKRIAIPIGEFFERCVYHGQIVRCDELFYEVITDAGICYSFNMLDKGEILNDIIDESLKNPKHGKKSLNWTLQDGYTENSSKVYPKRVLGSGFAMSLNVWLNMNIHNIDFKCNGFLKGFRLSLHSPTDIPRFSKDYYPIPIKKLVQFSVRPEVIKTSDGLKNYKPGVRQCYFDGEKHLKFFKVYTQSNCELECLSNYTQKSCNCVKLGHPHETGTKICARRAEACYSEAEYNWSSGILSQKANGSQPKFNECKCLPSCTSLEYTAKISQNDFYYEQYFNALNITHRKNIMMSNIKIYFKKNNIIALKRSELFGLTDFLSDCGGLVGVFMGFSILSIIEFAYHIFLRSIFGNQNPDYLMNNDEHLSLETVSIISLEMEINPDNKVEHDKEEVNVEEYWYIEIESL